MAWKGEAEGFCYGISHQGICPLLKQWRQVAKGKVTVESAGLREAMVEYLRAAVSAEPKGIIRSHIYPVRDRFHKYAQTSYPDIPA